MARRRPIITESSFFACYSSFGGALAWLSHLRYYSHLVTLGPASSAVSSWLLTCWLNGCTETNLLRRGTCSPASLWSSPTSDITWSFSTALRIIAHCKANGRLMEACDCIRHMYFCRRSS